MGASLYWASDDNGTALVTAEPLDYGSINKDSESSAQTIYLYQDGATNLYNCSFVLKPVLSADYTGSRSPMEDYNMLLEWGDATDEDDFGGILVNMNATGSWANGWATYDAKSPTYGFVCRTGVADSESNKVQMVTNMGCSAAGVIQSNYPDGHGINVRFQTKILVPNSVTVLGDIQYDLAVYFTYTS